jgi:hypothetical protein
MNIVPSYAAATIRGWTEAHRVLAIHRRRANYEWRCLGILDFLGLRKLEGLRAKVLR